MRGVAPIEAIGLGARVSVLADEVQSIIVAVASELAALGRPSGLTGSLGPVDEGLRAWSSRLRAAVDHVSHEVPWFGGVEPVASSDIGDVDRVLVEALEQFQAIAVHRPAADILESPVFGGALELLRGIDLVAFVAVRGDVGVLAWSVAFDAALVLDAMKYPVPEIPPPPSQRPGFPQGLFDELVLAVVATRVQQVGAAAVDVHSELNMTSILSGLAALRIARQGAGAVSSLGRPASRPNIRIVDGGFDEAWSIFEVLTVDGAVVGNSTYAGVLVRLPDDTLVGLRTTMSNSPSAVATIDVHLVGQRPWKVKFVP